MGSCITSKKKASIAPTGTLETLSQAAQQLNAQRDKLQGFPSAPETPTEVQRKLTKKKPKIHAKQSEGGVKEAPTAKVTIKAKTSWELQLISIAFQRHSVLTELTDDVRDVIVEKMKHYLLGPNETIFEAGAPGVNLFIVSTGTFEVLVNGSRVNVLKPGDSFGEQALLHDTPRSATIRTLERCTMWGIDRKSFRDAVETVNAKNYEENHRFLDSANVLSVLTDKQKEALISVLNPQKIVAGKKIVVEGETGELCYLIKEGSVSVSIKGVEQRKLSKGDFFGEQALLYNSVRTATVTALDTVKLFSIGRPQLTEALGESLQQVIYRNTMRMAFDKTENLKNLTKDQKELVMSNLEVQNFQSGAVVIPAKTNITKGLWIVLRGTLRKSGTVFAQKLDTIGDRDLMTGSSHILNEDVVAEDVTDIAHASLQVLETSLGSKLFAILAENEILGVLKKVQIFKGFSKERLNQLVTALECCDYEDGECIVRQNDEGSAFFIIKSGKVVIEKDGVVLRMINKHDYFGERSILFQEPRTASVVAQGDVSCWMLSGDAFNRIINDAVKRQLITRINIQNDNVKISDLKAVKQLGRGMFGNVTLCTHMQKGTLYAVKTIPRRKIRLYDLTINLVLERQVLLQLDHTFIMKLIKTHKDMDRIYFIQEYVHGQDLFDVMRVLGLLQDQDAKFYTACLVLIIEHLHERDIVYRDLKPENIMVDDMGYPKLIDFGTAKIVPHGRTFTTVGTPHYTAPEVLLGRGYGGSADYWSLGIMLYEFLCGQMPFGEDEDDSYTIYEKVLHSPLEFPRIVGKTFPAKGLIEALLNRNPAQRTSGGLDKVKCNRWFHNMDWEALQLRQMKSPHVPKVRNLAEDINRALRKRESLELFLAMQERIENVQGEEAHPEPPGWDSEF